LLLACFFYCPRPWTGIEPADTKKKYSNTRTDFKKVTVRMSSVADLGDDALFRMQKTVIGVYELTEVQASQKRTTGSTRAPQRASRCVE
jgi:hypothetical protein